MLFNPGGLVQAFIIGEEFIGNDACIMILGNNILLGNNLGNMMKNDAKGAEKGLLYLDSMYMIQRDLVWLNLIKVTKLYPLKKNL